MSVPTSSHALDVGIVEMRIAGAAQHGLQMASAAVLLCYSQFKRLDMSLSELPNDSTVVRAPVDY